MYLLEPVGLSESDNAAYVALVGARKVTAAELAKLVNVSTASAGRSLRRLTDAGLVTRLRTRPTRFVPAPPEVAVEALVARRQQDLRDLRADSRELAQRLDETFPTIRAGLVELVDGYEATTQHIAQAQLGAQEEVLVVDAPPYLDVSPVQNLQELQLLERGVPYRAIYDRSSLEMAGHYDFMMECVRAGEQARTMNAVTMKMLIIDRKVAFVPNVFGGGETSSALIVRASPLLDALLECFEWLWAKAVPVGGDPADRDAGLPRPGEPTQRDRRLLALMATGMKDRAIARTLGITERTLSRHIHELMTSLEADTRFQAGMQAFRRGWLRPSGEDGRD
ncbi:regulatory protein, luxR family [Actinokineospora alba]|uniref:Regulatory protein, luxR family n=1 Tax=Actinokineospora alba TaxID=504798 RepID=A0A1H0VH88_9PSEU|nr:helix-turn-helix domain-containing protein [Actinokineospora alba]TDP67726.1 regulatory LuxR family protein [Actinokineospora alba]SDJ27407.1 regulatory protein, luxR family [Actinokineospora alba]SDP77857.1 regulatory protein, luxR family [Actinokineospora alba]